MSGLHLWGCSAHMGAAAHSARPSRSTRHGVQALLCAAVLAAALPARAGVWAFATDAPLLLGGALSGSFAGVDLDADGALQASEVDSFIASYTGMPPATSSFSISGLGLGDAFSFGLASGSLGFSVTDGANRSISGDSFGLSAVVGSGFVDAGAQLTVTAVPEPAGLGLVLLALGLAGALRLRRHQPEATRADNAECPHAATSCAG